MRQMEDGQYTGMMGPPPQTEAIFTQLVLMSYFLNHLLSFSLKSNPYLISALPMSTEMLVFEASLEIFYSPFEAEEEEKSHVFAKSVHLLSFLLGRCLTRVTLHVLFQT